MESDKAVGGKSSREAISEAADGARSLVCGLCWNGLFSRQSFREIWESPGSLIDVKKQKSFSYSSTWNRIDASSRAGCNWCSLLLGSVDPTMHDCYSEDEDSLFRTFGRTIRVAFGKPSYFEGVLMGAQLVSAWVGDYQLFQYPVYTLPDDPSAKEVLARERIRRMKSTETCRLAIDYVSNCHKHHSGCPKPSHDRVLPTRVIDCTNPEDPRLCITGGAVRGSYVALSYVWGEDQPNKTTARNIGTYTQGIDLGLLPQTIRDAVWVTHACNETYLWVDALCIIQDSREDKHREIAKIPQSFADASFTIIAARSPRASDGFLHDCQPPSVPVRHLPFPCKGDDDPGRFGTFYVEQDVLGKHDDDLDLNEPVHKRAWCLEERLLSPRALVYTSSTLGFHCQLIRANIGNAVRATHDLADHRLAIEWMPGLGDGYFDPKADSAFDYNRSTTLWDNIIHNYTGRAVTQVEDKLIALAGVASRFAARWKKGDYLSGLWLDNLQHDILWHIAVGAQQPRPEAYRAPSWSWASTEGSVVAAKLHPHETPLYELTGYEVTRVSPTLSFGGVTAGHLAMRAPLLRATWRDDGLYACLPWVDTQSCATETKLYHAWRDAIGPCSADAWLLLIVWRAKSDELLGLVVVRAEYSTEYRRVGCFQHFSVSKDDVLGLDRQEIVLK
ncbi:HET-domain-containing protein [Lasiosphaeria hispida]|uniref:HET-domain-containing protein n=1 Tax=Lasiosphaeria hispida TaxID=260671 RepID=A0AAJ0M7R7_9PEZI|nr:HET-domain-containing protein [Lasiosphaeria hispida]